MPKANIIKLPHCTPAEDPSDTLLLCAASPHFEEGISYKCAKKENEWYIEVRAKTVDGLIDLLYQYKRIMRTIVGEAVK